MVNAELNLINGAALYLNEGCKVVIIGELGRF